MPLNISDNFVSLARILPRRQSGKSRGLTLEKRRLDRKLRHCNDATRSFPGLSHLYTYI